MPVNFDGRILSLLMIELEFINRKKIKGLNFLNIKIKSQILSKV